MSVQKYFNEYMFPQTLGTRANGKFVDIYFCVGCVHLCVVYVWVCVDVQSWVMHYVA